MARSGLCAKCHKGQAAEEDSWCKLCSAVENLHSLARENWSTVAYRKLAEDLLTDIVRNCRALVLDRRTRSLVDSYSHRKGPAEKPVHPWKRDPQSLQTSAKAGAKPPERSSPQRKEVKEEGEARGDRRQEVEREEGRAEAASSAGRSKPPEPRGPPPERVRSSSRTPWW